MTHYGCGSILYYLLLLSNSAFSADDLTRCLDQLRVQDTHYTFENTYSNLTVTWNELLAWEVEAFDGFFLGLLTHDVLMVAASAAAKVHFNHSLYCSSLLPPLQPLFQSREPGQGANHAGLGAGEGQLERVKNTG